MYALQCNLPSQAQVLWVWEVRDNLQPTRIMNIHHALIVVSCEGELASSTLMPPEAFPDQPKTSSSCNGLRETHTLQRDLIRQPWLHACVPPTVMHHILVLPLTELLPRCSSDWTLHILSWRKTSCGRSPSPSQVSTLSQEFVTFDVFSLINERLWSCVYLDPKVVAGQFCSYLVTYFRGCCIFNVVCYTVWRQRIVLLPVSTW